jgi:hypothetical protein
MNLPTGRLLHGRIVPADATAITTAENLDYSSLRDCWKKLQRMLNTCEETSSSCDLSLDNKYQQECSRSVISCSILLCPKWKEGPCVFFSFQTDKGCYWYIVFISNVLFFLLKYIIYNNTIPILLLFINKRPQVLKKAILKGQ